MKTVILLIVVATVTTACPGSTYNNNQLKAIQQNGMDFPNLRKVYYNGIHFMLSDLFTNDYADNYTLMANADTKIIYTMDLNFSVELFVPKEVETIQYAFDQDISPLDAVHDNYIIQRQNSLDEPTTSIKKPTPKSVKYPGYIQVVSGSPYSNENPSAYFLATLEIEGEYFVFQMIGTHKNMGYLYDDFIDLLSSVEK